MWWPGAGTETAEISEPFLSQLHACNKTDRHTSQHRQNFPSNQGDVTFWSTKQNFPTRQTKISEGNKQNFPTRTRIRGMGDIHYNIGVPLKSLYIPGRNPRTRVSRNSPEMLAVFLSRTGSSNNLKTEGSLRALEHLKACTSWSGPSVLEFWSERPAFQIEWVFWISLGCQKMLIPPIKTKTITTV